MIRHHRPALLTAGVLTLLGVACVAMRLNARQKISFAHGDSIWRLSYRITFRAANATAQLRAALPLGTPHLRILQEKLVCPGSSIRVVHSRRTGVREAVATPLPESNPSRLTAHVEIHVSPNAKWPKQSPGANLSPATRAYYLRAENDIQTSSAAVAEALSSLTGKGVSEQELLDRLFRHCSHEISSSDEGVPLDAAGALEAGKAGALGRARAMAALCRASHLPARLVSGFVLNHGQRLRPHVWVEVCTAKKWTPCDPEYGYSGELPPTYVPVRRDGVAVVSGVEGAELTSRFSARRLRPPLGLPPPRAGRLWEALDPTRLSPSMQRTISLILLLPIGGLVAAVSRNIIGVETFGTFTPALLAMSFVDADWVAGLVVLGVALVIGLSGRALLNRLKLLAVPRVGVVLTLVVLSLAMAVSVLDYFKITPAAQAVLFPMVILTMTIERFHVSSEEEGVAYGLKVLAGTFAVGLCCFLLLRSESLRRLAIDFPEGHFFTIALFILIGRYAGYRLTELWRFRDAARPLPPKESR